MIKNILLIDVECDRTTNSRSQLQTRWSHHPIGLMYIATAVEKAFKDIKFEILHTVTCLNAEDSVESLLVNFQPDLVGLRSLNIFQDRFHKIARLIRDKAPNTLLIGGGPYPSSSYKKILEDKIVDLAVLGEGEKTFVELVAWLRDHDHLPDDLSGTAVLKNGKSKLNAARSIIENLDELPIPNYNLINLSDYKGISNLAFQEADKSAFMEASRGCTYKCYYCHAALSKTVRRRAPHLVLEELEIHYSKRGIRDFVFVDDIFNVPKDVAKEILRLIIQRFPGVRLNFSNGLRADQLDDEILDLLEEAGTVHIALAVETATPRLQKLIVKNLRLKKAKEMIHKASQRFIVCTFFMVGFPTETMEEAKETVNFARDLTYLAQPVLNIVRVYPGTPIFDALDPTPEQAQLIDEQASANPTIKATDNPNFYGDFFPRNKVPMVGKDITAIRLQWMRHVLLNKERIRNSYNVMRKFFNEDQIIHFNKNFFDNPDFKKQELTKLLGQAGNMNTGSSKSLSHTSPTGPLLKITPFN